MIQFATDKSKELKVIRNKYFNFKLLTPKLSDFLINKLRSQVDLVITITCSIIPYTIKYFQQSASNFLSRKKAHYFKSNIRRKIYESCYENCVPSYFTLIKLNFNFRFTYQMNVLTFIIKMTSQNFLNSFAAVLSELSNKVK